MQKSAPCASPADRQEGSPFFEVKSEIPDKVTEVVTPLRRKQGAGTLTLPTDDLLPRVSLRPAILALVLTPARNEKYMASRQEIEL
jgi:hypothetical protein